MPGVNRKIQPVSFNQDDPFENSLRDFAMKQGPFSKYVKRLIQRDMERGVRVTTTKKAPEPSHVIHGGTNAFTGFVLGQK
jgi:hypothetical protein